ncbi:MAG: hypothetical protein MJZ70_04420 [Bacteroidales bacterium]|nr:hypothetical protein [Bacteroidales bacterium]
MKKIITRIRNKFHKSYAFFGDEKTTLEMVTEDIERILEHHQVSFQEAVEMVKTHCENWAYTSLDEKFALIMKTKEMRVLKEKYKDRLTKPTENDNANQNNEQK